MERERRKRIKHDSKTSAFEKLRQLKSGGAKHKYEIGEVENVYDEIPESEFIERALKRQEEDWIVGDSGADGYIEDGREIFDDDLDEESVQKQQKSKKRDRSGTHKIIEGPKGNIEHMLANMPVKKKKVVKLDEDDVLGDLMKELDSSVEDSKKLDVNPVNKVKEDENIKAQEYLKSFVCPPTLKLPQRISKPSLERKVIVKTMEMKNMESKEQINSKTEDDLLENVDINEFNSEFDDDVVGMLDDIEKPVSKISFETISSKESPVLTKTEMAEKELSSSWETIVADTENEVNGVSVCVDVSQLETIDQEGKKVFRFFYWDAFEDVYSQPGTVYLFGKVWLESAKTYASCCVVIKNISRQVYLLPREKNLLTDEVVKILDVYNEFKSHVSSKYKITKFRSRKVEKKYAFNIQDVPDESEYLEVSYSATDSALPMNLSGNTFSHVFGTNTSYLELFLLQKQIKGPCWLNLSDPEPASNNASWCKFEVICNDIDSISVFRGGTAPPPTPPPLVVMAISMRITAIPKTHENQITMISCFVHSNFHTDKPAPNPPFQHHFCAFTKPADGTWPHDVKNIVGQLKTKLDKKDSERELLNFFLAKYSRIDPDLIVGHDIFGFDIGTLIHRLVVNKVMQWSRLGRLRRANASNIGKGKSFAERNIMCGRLMCDVKVSAKELIRARSYELDSLCEQVLHSKEGERKEVKSEEVKMMYSSSKSLINLIKLTMDDTLYILRIMYELNVIPLALQITNVAGNVLSRTLMGGRSERNEFLLLHAFYEKDYILPDKVYAKKTIKTEGVNEDGDVGSSKSKRKPQYEGGLVLDPKKGFYDKLILLMDFNSLYPSIIQEYNICYTNIPVRRIDINNEADMMVLMEHLPSDKEAGILPTEIRKLVECRKKVKELMTQPGISSELRHQYDIRQMAYKLTANSMYGCLGFPNSRFYAKPLAAMVTAKGREILMNTRDLVQKLNYDVIYGDTDSLMINTNSVNYDDVFSVGRKIQVEVNKLYKKIELEIDGVFKYMLLLKKKKYAAVTINKVDGKVVCKEEIKGLDMVRRDWSKLSAAAGKFALKQILSDQDLDDKIANIHAHLRQLKKDLEEEKVPLSLLAITKQLTKNPEDYPDKKALSHVQVALRMNSTRTKKFKQGDTIAYVICEDGTANAAIQRAYHLDEKREREDLKIDVKYYLSQQIHPVVTRLCEPIDGIDAIQIAETLGLDSAAYQRIRQADASMNDDDEITIDDADRYKNCDSFEFKCAACGFVNTVEGPTVKNDSGEIRFVLDQCCNISCHELPFTYVYRIQNTLQLKIRSYIHKYYSRWLICEDPTCAYRTRNITIYNKKYESECSQCRKNIMIREYTESQLFNQFCYFQYMFDITQAISKNKNLRKDKDDPSFQAYLKLKELVDTALKANAYNVIDLRKISELMMMK